MPTDTRTEAPDALVAEVAVAAMGTGVADAIGCVAGLLSTVITVGGLARIRRKR